SLVAGAATQVARQSFADLVERGTRVLFQEGVHRDDEAGRAESALQAVRLAERLLHRTERPVGRTDALDGDDISPFGLHREHQARTHRGAVDEHGARAAHSVLATEVGTGE